MTSNGNSTTISSTARRASGPRLSSLTGPDGGLIGPFNAMLYAPAVGEALQALGVSVRYGTSLTDRARSSRSWRWPTTGTAPSSAGPTRRSGARSASPTTRSRRCGPGPSLTLDDPTERSVVEVARALLSHGDLDDEEFDEARAALGLPALVELSTLVGYYRTLALQMRISASTPGNAGRYAASTVSKDSSGTSESAVDGASAFDDDVVLVAVSGGGSRYRDFSIRVLTSNLSSSWFGSSLPMWLTRSSRMAFSSSISSSR